MQLSKRGRVFKSFLLILAGLILLLIASNLENAFLGTLISVLVSGVIIIRLKTVSLHFDDNGIKLGNQKFDYSQIEDIRWFGYNFEYYLIFKMKNQSFLTRYRFVDMRVISILDFIKMFKKDNPELPITQFADLLKEKSSLSNERIEKVLNS